MPVRHQVTIALGLAQTLAWASSYYLPAILAAPIAADLRLNPAWVFGAFSAALLVAALVGPLAGREIDRRGGRDVLIASNLLFAAGLIALGLAQGAATLTLAWLVIGIAMAAGLYDAAFATLAGLWGRHARGPITGVTLMAGFASTVGWPLTAFLSAHWGWRMTCFAWAAGHLCLGLPLHRLAVPSVRGSAAAAMTSAAETPTTATPLLLALLAYVFAAGWFVSTAMAAHLPALLEAGGASVETALIAGALVGPAQVSARLVEFGLLRHSHPLTSARIAVALHPIGALLFAVFGAPAAAFAILHGAGNGLLTIAVGTLPLALFGPQGYGLRQGLLGAPARLGQAAAPLLFGLLLARLGVGALVVTSVALILALAALIAIGRLAGRARPNPSP